jgi:hypothetical protein
MTTKAEGDRQKTQGGGRRNKSNNFDKEEQKTVQLFESVSFE